MKFLALALLTLTLWAQGTTQTQALPNPYGNPARSLTSNSTAGVRNPGYFRRGIGRRGGIFLGGGVISETRREVLNEPAPPVPEDKLKELIVSPVYERPKINPKLIEIP
jgi:hypothetical protein